MWIKNDSYLSTKDTEGKDALTRRSGRDYNLVFDRDGALLKSSWRLANDAGAKIMNGPLKCIMTDSWFTRRRRRSWGTSSSTCSQWTGHVRATVRPFIKSCLACEWTHSNPRLHPVNMDLNTKRNEGFAFYNSLIMKIHMFGLRGHYIKCIV